MVVSFSLTEMHLAKLKALSYKYELTQSAIINCLLNQIDHEHMNFEGEFFKLNTNKAVLDLHREEVFPELTHKDYIFNSFHTNTNGVNKIKSLRVKYKTSVSAIVRILLNNCN